MDTTIWDIWLEPLTGKKVNSEDRRKIIQDNIMNIIRAGYNQTETLEIFKRNGVGINPTDFGQIYNANYIHVQEIDWLSSLPGDYELSDFDVKRGNTDYTAKYNIIIGYKYYDPETDTIGYATTSLLTDTLGTIDDHMQDALEAIQQTDSMSINGQVLDYGLIRVYKNPLYIE